LRVKNLRVFGAILISFIGIVVSIYFSTILHFKLSGSITRVSLIPLSECLESIWGSRNHHMLFLCMCGFSILMGVAFYLSNSRPYQSSLMKITPQINTPVAAGQKQFGSAEWLSEKDKETAFESCIINPNDEIISELLSNGKDSVDSLMQNSDDSTNKKAEINSQRQNYLAKGGAVLGLNKTLDRDNIYFIGDDIHMLCIGATRSGKSRTVVLQSICTLGLAGESVVISDPKGELYQYTFPFLNRLGYEVLAIDFKNPLKSHRYNFLQPIIDAVDQDDMAKAIDATWDLTSALVGEPKGERIWTDGEASIIASAIMSVVYDNRELPYKKYQNMTNVYFFIAEMCKTINNTMPIIEYVKKLADDHPAKALLAISEVAPAKTRGSFYTAALTTLRLFTSPLINSMTCTSDYYPKNLGKRKMALFIILPDEKTTYYTIASLLVSQHYEQLVNTADERGGRLENRVNFLLDEFGNYATITGFANKLTVGGGRGIRFNLFLQSFAQLKDKYGEDVAKVIKGNCHVWIYLQAEDNETLEEISKRLGNYTVSTYSLSSSHGKYSNPSSSHSINLTGRPLLMMDEVRMISRPYSLITSRSNPAIMYCPDLSKWMFNKMLGLGDVEHNRKVREQREKARSIREIKATKMELWNVWKIFIAACEQQTKQITGTNKKEQPTGTGSVRAQNNMPYIYPMSTAANTPTSISEK